LDGEVRPLLGGIPDGHGAEFQADTEALLEQTVGLGKVPNQPGTHRATTDQTNTDLVHGVI
jgi:hypothetical protein